jgi:DNA-binding CsgD family transcriptional regulator
MRPGRLAELAMHPTVKPRRWLDEMLSGSVKSIEEIANREGCSPRKVNMTLTLAKQPGRSPSRPQTSRQQRQQRHKSSKVANEPSKMHRESPRLGATGVNFCKLPAVNADTLAGRRRQDVDRCLKVPRIMPLLELR